MVDTSASVHSICTSSALPSDLLRRSSAVVIEQAQCKIRGSLIWGLPRTCIQVQTGVRIKASATHSIWLF